MDSKQKALKDLVRIADLMEQTERDDPFRKQLQQKYKCAMAAAGIPKRTKSHEIPSAKIKASKEDCLSKIIIALNGWDAFQEKTNSLYVGQQGEILFSYNVNHNGYGHEMQLLLFDVMYSSYSGYKAGKCRVSLFSQKQLKGYSNLEYAVISFGLELVPKNEKEAFFKKYAEPYNAKIKK